MYPPLPSVDSTLCEEVTLPNGRRVELFSSGYVEGDTNAFVEQEFRITDLDSGDELTPDEFNARIEFEGRMRYLHEVAYELASREADKR